MPLGPFGLLARMTVPPKGGRQAAPAQNRLGRHRATPLFHGPAPDHVGRQQIRKKWEMVPRAVITLAQ